jgi:hypothetical protein
VEAALAYTVRPDALERFPAAAEAACAHAGHELLWAQPGMPAVTSSDGGGWTRPRYEPVMVVRVQARTARQAMALAENAAQTALRDAGIDLVDRGEPFQTAPFATGSRAAQANTKHI